MLVPQWLRGTSILILCGLMLLALGHEVGAQASDPGERLISRTGYVVDNDTIWNYFQTRGGADTMGYPVSRTFLFRGLEVQIFQRHVLQVVGNQARPLNLLDPDLMPVTRINHSTLPEHDPSVATAAPAPDTPAYGSAVTNHITRFVPNDWEGEPVGFRDYYLAASPGTGNVLVALEVWGFPTSRPMRDPNNHNFIYQRFQRGIMHYDASSGVTRGILLGETFRNLLRGRELPADFRKQMADSPFLRLYDPARPLSLAREVMEVDPPITRANSNLTNAFARFEGIGMVDEVSLYLVDQRQSDRTTCAITLSAVEQPIEPTRRPLLAALEELTRLGQSSRTDLYNAVYLAHDIRVEGVAIENSTAHVNFSGSYQVERPCDLEWFATQVRQTALQFETVDDVEIRVDGQPLEFQGLPITERVNIYLIAEGDEGRGDKLIGCGDSVVPVAWPVQPTSMPLTAALRALLSIKEREVGDSGLSNALWQAELQVDRIQVKDRTAHVYLTGQAIRGGVCDDPRLEAQLQETVLQFEGIDEVQFYFDGQGATFPMEGQR